MRQHAWFWRFWRITPEEFRRLTVAEHTAMVEVMDEVARQNEKAAHRARARR